MLNIYNFNSQKFVTKCRSFVRAENLVGSNSEDKYANFVLI